MCDLGGAAEVADALKRDFAKIGNFRLRIRRGGEGGGGLKGGGGTVRGLKRVPLTMGQDEMEEEEGESETPLTLPHGCFVTLAIP